jgi:hypothetical protein
MFQNEDDFNKIVSQLDIDDKPNPGHRESLRGRMLSVFNKSGEQPETESRPLWRTIMKSPIKKFAIAAAIIVAALIVIEPYIPLTNGSGIAFADVLEQIRTFRPYSCTVTSQYKGKPAITRRLMRLTLLRRREVFPDGYVQIFDLSQDPVKMLAIHPDKMLAIEKTSPDIEPGRDFDLLRYLSIIQDENDLRLTAAELGLEEIDGQRAKIFRVPGEYNEWTIWADAQTGLPIRIELNHPKIGQKITMSEFEFDVDFDESLFAMTAPEGYTVKKVVEPTEQDLIEGLGAVAKFLGGEFPSVFRLRPLQKVLAEYVEQNNLSPSQDEMHSLGEKLSPGMKYFAKINTNKDFFKLSYVGGGVRLGDANTAILWYTPQGTPNYHVVYGDLSVREVTPNNLPTESKEANTMVALEIKLPKPMFVGTPKPLKVPHWERPLGKPRPSFYAPVGTENVAFGKPVFSTDEEPFIGEIEMITDGDKEAADGSFVELGSQKQHITIDLEGEYNIYAIVIWHYHKEGLVFFDVAVQVCNEPDFITNVRTLFNNDIDNSLGLGVGKDMHYTETAEGKLIDAKGTVARYVRLHSNGSTGSDENYYIEVEVYGKAEK